jgi:hypothetical protein
MNARSTQEQLSQSQHLNDDQFAECLTAEYPQPVVQAHLAGCDRCREELGVFMASMDDFSHAALGWSRAKQEIPRTGFKPVRRSFLQPLQWALACVLALAVGVPVAVHLDRTDAASPSVNSADAGDSAAQIAQDNRLMQSVDLALGQSDPSPYQEYHLDEPQNPAGTRLRAE